MGGPFLRALALSALRWAAAGLMVRSRSLGMLGTDGRFQSV